MGGQFIFIQGLGHNQIKRGGKKKNHFVVAQNLLGHSLDALGGVVARQLVQPLLHNVIHVLHLHFQTELLFDMF